MNIRNIKNIKSFLKFSIEIEHPEYRYRFTHGYDGRTFVLENYLEETYGSIVYGTKPHKVVGEVVEELPSFYNGNLIKSPEDDDIVILGRVINPRGLVFRIKKVSEELEKKILEGLSKNG